MSASCTITAKDARMIYKVKVNGKNCHDAGRLALQYCITPKAVRDIWRHRTWKHATMSLWMPVEIERSVKRTSRARCCGNEATGMRPKDSLLRGTHDDIQGDVLVAPLPQRMDQVWKRRNANLGGLLDEALHTICMPCVVAK